MLFTLLITFVIVQRLFELFVAKRNEKWMLSRGAYEVGALHYPVMVAMHIGFFVTLILEVLILDRPLSSIWIPLLSLFIFAQIIRFWCLFSLGKYWNTKIIILPGADVVRKGPYRFFRHPNYLIVTIELLVLPLIFNAFGTLFIYFILNIWMLSIRIPVEERALREATNYSQLFSLK
ncbi:isoprenylcysteine carboxyl methyltransferase family protein [Sporosarcina siberiensis]|uniref:Isoprenylcysteine carboxyl methyltransferase family protein n=1 Tax=Sporosarcina siberiensis TaxID=1365606 RepID=A0ABW4SIL4_9BACL